MARRLVPQWRGEVERSVHPVRNNAPLAQLVRAFDSQIRKAAVPNLQVPTRSVVVSGFKSARCTT